MNRRAFLSTTLTTATISASLLLGLSAPFAARAQNAQQGQQGRAQRGQMRGGGQWGNPAARMSSMADPTIPNLTALLKRNDVRRELLIDGRQRDSLDELETSSQAEMGGKMRAAFQDTQKATQGMSQQERRDYMQQNRDQMRTQFQDVMTAVQGDLDKKTEAILRPSQVKRLHELDLQWRGPLALGATSLADKLDLTPEQRAKIAEAVLEYRGSQAKVFQAAFSNMANRRQRPNGNNANGANNPPAAASDPSAPVAGDAAASGAAAAPAPPSTPAENQARADEVQKEMERMRKTIGAKALLVLKPEQIQTWRTMQGRPFTFSVVD